MARVLAALAAVLISIAPGPAKAQVPLASSVADSMAQCLTTYLGDALRAPATVEPIPNGWRVALPLRGQGPQPDAQTPLPSEDVLAWVDLILYESSAAVPDDSINNINSKVILIHPTALAMYHGGFFYFGLANVARPCAELATGGTFERR
jgi:hypothetical protein